MKHFRHRQLIKGLSALGLFLAMDAGAADPMVSRKVALCPWQVAPSAHAVSAIAAGQGRAEAARVLELVPEHEVLGALEGEPCDVAVEVLAPLATKTNAAYALVGKVEQKSDRLVLDWRLVTNGRGSSTPKAKDGRFQYPLGGMPIDEALAEAFVAFYSQVIVPSTPPIAVSARPQPIASTRPSERRPLAVEPSLPELSSVETNATIPWKPVGLGIAGAGLVSLVTSGILVLAVQGDQARLRAEASDGVLPRTTRNEEAVRGLNATGTWAGVTLAAGTSLLVGGALLYWLGPSHNSAATPGIAWKVTGTGLGVKVWF